MISHFLHALLFFSISLYGSDSGSHSDPMHSSAPVLLLFLFIIHYFVLIIVRQMKKFHMMNITNYQKKNKKNTV